MSARTDSRRVSKRKVKDAQTGRDFDVIPEGRIDTFFAWVSAAYSLAVIGYLVWLVIEVKSAQSQSTIANTLKPFLSANTSKLIFYTALGGAMGAAVNNLRSFITWHAEERAFGWRFIWKYLAMPPLGGTLAVLVYGILQSGMAVLTGGNGPGNSEVSSLSAWAAGTLAGYGSHKVFKWLDDKVNTLFKVDATQVVVPDVKGKSLDEAKQVLADAKLGVGAISNTGGTPEQVGKVITQTPDAGSEVDCTSKVELTIGVASDAPVQPPDVPQNGDAPAEPVVAEATVVPGKTTEQ